MITEGNYKIIRKKLGDANEHNFNIDTKQRKLLVRNIFKFYFP
jgi:hypothetical protein